MDTPYLLLDAAIAKRNIARMAEKARASNVLFRPHFKTHQSAEVAQWYRAEGVEAITVSSLKMAQYFASHGWTDITLAFPVNRLDHQAIDALAVRLQSLHAAHHAAMGCLGAMISTAQSTGQRLDGQTYLACVQSQIDNASLS